MKGYLVSGGYMGLVEGEYMLFASESDYQEYMEEIKRIVETKGVLIEIMHISLYNRKCAFSFF